MLGLLVSMKDGERLSLEQIRAFLEASEEVGFKIKTSGKVVEHDSGREEKMAAFNGERKAMNVRETVRAIQAKVERDRGTARSGAPDANPAHANEVALLRGAYERLYQMRALVGQTPPSPGTFRARIGANLVRAVQRMLFWYTPQIHRVQNETTAAIGSLCNLIEMQQETIAALCKEVRSIHFDAPAGQASVNRAAAPDGQLPQAFEFALQNHFRGPEHNTEEKLRIWLSLIEERLGGSDADWFDIGCGRGEWLFLASQRNHKVSGVDANPIAVDQCLARGLAAEQGDALAYLERFEDGSLGAVTAFHVVEHLPMTDLLTLVRIVARKLRPGGVFAIETPNPANVLMGSHHFWNDPTHQRPIPEALLRFVLEYFSLKVVKRIGLNPFPPAAHLPYTEIDVVGQVDELFYGSRDYGLLGRRES